MKFRLTRVALAAAAFLSLPAEAAPEETASSTPTATEKKAEADGTVAAPVTLDKVVVEGEVLSGYTTRATSTATKTDTPLRDVPQSVSVIPRALIEDQAMQGIADAIRYVPGAGMAQGEGNRETPILRGNSTTSDFFVNGIRDDLQYYRDLYNIERLEILKGPNAMIFGRGGVGGVINRVTRQADWESEREVTAQVGSFGHKRVSGDLGTGFNANVAGRITAVYEDSGSYRDGVDLTRYGFNPTLALRTGPDTTAVLSYEYFNDERVADRGVASFNGKPFPTDDSTFFGNPDESPTGTELNVTALTVTHRFSDRLSLKNATSYGDYSKYYQNVFASGAVIRNSSTGVLEVPLQAYRADTDRNSLFNQTDLVLKLNTGPVAHTLLAGVEIGRQTTDNLRLTRRFADANGDSVPETTLTVPATSPTVNTPLVDSIVGMSDGNNLGTTKVAAIYLQDQAQLSPKFQAVVGVRLDRVEVDFTNRRADAAPADRELSSRDDLVSPRVGLIYKPIEPVSVYASYTLSYLPRAGEQLASLTPSNKAIDPEEFTNYELGAKWDLREDLSLTAAIYQLDRSNVLLVNPVAGQPAILGDGARITGVELSANGRITKAWSIVGGYAYQDGALTGTSNSATARDGAALSQLPLHTVSLWNRYDFTPVWGMGVGAFYRSEMYTSTSNAVSLDGYTRVDGAVFWNPSPRWRAQVNVENLLGEDYYVNAHNDNNILPGAPLSLRASVTARF